MHVSMAIRVWILLLFSLLIVPAGRCQSAPQDSDRESTSLPTIDDEPTTIDPAQFLPKPLSEKATADFSGSSLREVAEWLRQQQGLVVLPEQEALADIGLLLGDPLSDKLDDDPVYLLLDRLRFLDLDWYYEDDILHITTQEVTASRLTTEPYSIGELLDAGHAGHTPDSLLEVILATVSRHTWDAYGGPGAASFLGDVLFIRQTDRVHREIRGLLEALQRTGRRTFIADPKQHAKLRESLAANVSVTFRDTPLEAAAEQLSKDADIDLRLDASALQDLGVRRRHPVTLSIRDRKLATVLQAMLLDLDLTYLVRDGVLWITSREVADSVMKTAVYDVRDLCRDEQESAALHEAIQSQTEPVWDTYGGNSSLHFAQPGTLVVRSTESILDEVLALLESYRAALRSSKPRAVTQQVDMNEVITVYYRTDTAVAEDLQSYLPSTVAPETWKSRDQEAVGVIYVIASTPETVLIRQPDSEGNASNTKVLMPKSVLVVTQTRAAHQEIRDVIDRVQSGDATKLQGGFGGGGFGGGFFSVPK